MKKTKKEASDLSDPTEFFDSLDQEVLLELVQYYPLHLKALCMLVSLDTQLAIEKQEKKIKRKKAKESYDNQGKI